MKYVIFGAGGTGGALAFYLSKAGKDVTLIARGAHLKALQEKGLTIRHLYNGTEETVPVNACTSEEYTGTCDVLFICVKGYSIDSTLPFIEKSATKDTVVLPILNIYGTGGKLQEKLPELYVVDSCIYVSAGREAPGILIQHAPIMRVVFGNRRGQKARPVLQAIADDLTDAGIEGLYSHHIEVAALKKFSYVSPAGAAGLYFNCTAGTFQKEGKERTFLKDMMYEVQNVAEAMGFGFGKDFVPINMKIMDSLIPETNTSMQRDVAAGHRSEVDGLVYEMVRLGKKYNVPVPCYTAVAEEMKKRGLE